MKCKKCGTENPERAKFCRCCGEKLNESNGNSCLILGIGIVVIMLIIIISLFASQCHNKTADMNTLDCDTTVVDSSTVDTSAVSSPEIEDSVATDESEPSENTSQQPYAEILKVVQEHNAVVNGQTGIKFVVDYNVFNRKDKQCSLLAYIYYDDDGSKFINSNASNTSTVGQVCAHIKFIPTLDGVRYTEWSVFIPYDDFAPLTEKTKLRAQIRIYDYENMKFLDDGNTWSYFTWR
jgi:hypothetical protein